MCITRAISLKDPHFIQYICTKVDVSMGMVMNYMVGIRRFTWDKKDPVKAYVVTIYDQI